VKVELENIIQASIIEPVAKFEWIIPMVVQDKKMRGIIFCVDFRKLNDACMHDSFLTLFIDEVLEKIGVQKAYSFTDGFSGYH
jgi:hypothetical protein